MALLTRAAAAGIGLFAIACFAAPPPPALPTELGGCHPGAY